MRSLLVVHERSIERRILHSGLTDCGYSVSQAADAAEALRLACEQQPDALILDADFESLCAQELCEELIQRTGDARPLICVISQHVDPKRNAWWSELPDTLLAERPLSLRALSDRIDRHFERATESA